jgi:hypothetical protein
MHNWSKEIEDAIARLNLSTAHEGEVVEELSQHLNNRYDEFLVAGTREEQARRILIDGRLIPRLKGTTNAAQQPVPVGAEDATSFLRACSLVLVQLLVQLLVMHSSKTGRLQMTH